MKINWITDGEFAAGGIPVGIGDLNSLHKQGISVVISLTEHPLTRQDGVDDHVFDSMNLEVLHMSIVDQQPPNVVQVVEFATVLNRMRAEGKAVYIHCHAGIGRTGTMLHAYYLSQGHSLDETKAMVKAAKPTSQFFMLSKAQQIFLEELAAQFGAE